MALWQPQPGPQTLLIACPVEDVLFGGARGGGKTFGLLGDFLVYALRYGGAAKGILFRRTYPELEEIERVAHEIYKPGGGSWLASSRTWIWYSGAQLKFRYMQREEDASNYQGHSFSWIGWDEITNWASPRGINKLRATLRSSSGIPCRWRVSGNPGGVGHNWVKQAYIDPAPPFVPFRDPISQISRLYIPATLDDNQILVRNDPDYWKRVTEAAAGREDLLKAWRDGSWDIVAGGMFDDIWDEKIHVLEPFRIPCAWRVDRTFDWGSSKPFSVQWWAESDGTDAPGGRRYPRGTLFHIAEWYGWTGKANEGVKLTDHEIAKGIKDTESQLMGRLIETVPLSGPADLPPGQPGAVSMADNMARMGVRWEPIRGTNRITGWQIIRKMLLAARKGNPEEPGLYVFSTCRQFIRTVSVLPRSERNPDDADTEAEDHAADACRYRVMAQRRQVRVVKVSGL
jgi:hypothetical protein